MTSLTILFDLKRSLAEQGIQFYPFLKPFGLYAREYPSCITERALRTCHQSPEYHTVDGTMSTSDLPS